jgi:membrane-associated phospholipid phosphatase
MKYIFFLLSCVFINNPVFSQNTDINLLKDINLHRNKNLDNTFKDISFSVYPVSISIPAAMICSAFIKKDSVMKEKGIYIASSILLAEGLAFGLKYAINRDRPDQTYSFIQNVTSEPSPSFPSGHTANAFATATSLSLAFSKWYVIAPSYLWACSVAYSRLDLGVHYPSDVLGGAIVGAGSAFLCYKANQWLYKRKVR